MSRHNPMSRASSPVVQFDHFYRHEEIHLLTLTDFRTASAEERPEYVIHGGSHAQDLPLPTRRSTRQKLLDDHDRDGLLTRAAFLIVPRLYPHGPEFYVVTSARMRSRTDFADREVNTIYPENMDSDGLIPEHPSGASRR